MKLSMMKSVLILASLLQASAAVAFIVPGASGRGGNEERGGGRGGDRGGPDRGGPDRGGGRPGGGGRPEPRPENPRPRPPGRPDPFPGGPSRPDPRPENPRPGRPDPRPDRPHRPPVRPDRPHRPDPRPEHPRPWPGNPRPDPRPDYPRPIPPPDYNYGEATVNFSNITRRTGGEWLRVGFVNSSYVDYVRVNLYNAGLKLHETYAVTVSGRRLVLRELSNTGTFYAVQTISSEYISAGERIVAIDIRAEAMGDNADISVTVESQGSDLNIYPTRP